MRGVLHRAGFKVVGDDDEDRFVELEMARLLRFLDGELPEPCDVLCGDGVMEVEVALLAG